MNFKKLTPFIIAILTFVIASLVYFLPVLEGKKLYQNDIAHFRGMSKEIQQFRVDHDQEPYWTNRAFGGMPSYQLSTYYPNDYIKTLDGFLRFLPRPADYLFLYFIGFFTLLLVLKIDWKLAIIGSLAFGFSTYFIIILGVGHNAKAHAIAYMPMVLAGLLLVFQKRYLLGFILTSLAMALEINTSHPQMTYYLMFMVIIFGIVYLIEAIEKKELSSYFKNIGILIIAVVLAIGVNATSLMATKQYADHSTRSKSELTINPDGSEREQTTGLSREYITEYSYGRLESFDLLIPRFMGGSNSENIGKDSNIYNFLRQRAGAKQALSYAENAPMYWGKQTIVAAPAYLGAVMIFLFLLGIFIVKGKLKKWLVVVTIFSILLSWGKNFSFLTDLFIDYMPLYNKFRAVSSIQVIAELAVPLLGILAVQKFIDPNFGIRVKIKALKNTVIVLGGLTLFFVVTGTSLFTFESFRDAGHENIMKGLTEIIIMDRKSIFIQDSFRSLLFVLMTTGVLWLFAKKKIQKNVFLICLLGIILLDLVDIDKRYVNNDDFISNKKIEQPFAMSQVDAEIRKDTSYYRVFNVMVDPMNDGSTSFYHNSIGGYHAAKLRRYQELFQFQIARNNMDVLNMLNTKYFIFPGKDNRPSAQLNEEANGNAWYINNLVVVDSADEEIKNLDSLNTKISAIIRGEFIGNLQRDYVIDSTAIINLTHYQANELIYESKTSAKQLAVFSEIYYKDGWNAYIDGVKTNIYPVNYVLRAIEIPSGSHKIEFKFEPMVIHEGNKITLISYVLMLIIPIGWYFKSRKNNNLEFAKNK